MEPASISPLNPLPWAVWVVILPMIAVEGVFLAGQIGFAGGPEAIGWRVLAVQRFGFSGALLEYVIETRRFSPEHLMRLVTYPFVHLAGVHTLFVVVLIAALGRAVGQVFHGGAVVAIFLASSIGAAMIYGAIFPEPYWLAGAYPAVFGLVGAYTFMLWNALAESGAPRLRAFALVGVLLGLRVLVGLTLGAGHEWAADVAGFAIGFSMSFLVSPGGWRGALERLRER